MAEASAAGSEPLARMRHDLRTPLAVIIGLAQVLERELSDPEQKQDAAEIVENGRKLQRLIDDLVDLAQAAGLEDSS